MKAEIIAVGSEIMLGDINNSHAKYISQKLAQLGIDVCYHTAVGDNKYRLTEVFSQAVMRSDLIITTGGLGPTGDDLTKEIVCKTLGLEMVVDSKVLSDIKDFFARIGRDMPECNAKQALVPVDADVVYNEHGTAPGIILEAHNREKIIILLPGPPSELIPMFDGAISDYLSALSDKVIVSENLKVIGIGESRVEDMTSDLLQGKNPTAALYAGLNQVRIRLTAKADTKEEAENLIAPLKADFKRRLGDTIYSCNDEKLEQVVVKLLDEKGLKLATAESCTGGLLSEKITAIPGSSNVFEYGMASYANRIKEKFLDVSPKTLYHYGAVSEHIAIEMALGAKKKSGADIAVGITGFAGPDGGNKHNPVGTVYIAVVSGDMVWTNRITVGHGLTNERDLVRETAALTALDMVRHIVIDSPKSTLYLKPIPEAFDSCADPVINEGEFTPLWLKILKQVVPFKGDPLFEIVRKSVILVAAVVFIISVTFFGMYINEKIVSDNIIEKTHSLYTTPPTEAQLYSLPYGYQDKFAGLYSVNKSIKGWITIPDSKMDFPVVQGETNDYYLQHDFYNNYNSNGVPFLDFRSSINEEKQLDDNTVIYAHNIKGGRFFAELCNYKDLDYYKQRPTITFDSVFDDMQWKVVGMFITNAEKEQDDGNIFMFNNYINFNSPAKFNWYMKEISRRSIIDTGVDFEYGDKILTLSTCTYEFEEARFVLVARKVRAGEDASVDVSKASYRSNPLYPKAYYDKKGGSKPDLAPNPEPKSYEETPSSTEEAPFYEFISSYNEEDYDFTTSYKSYINNVSSKTSSTAKARPGNGKAHKSVSSKIYVPPSSKSSTKKTSSKK